MFKIEVEAKDAIQAKKLEAAIKILQAELSNEQIIKLANNMGDIVRKPFVGDYIKNL